MFARNVVLTPMNILEPYVCFVVREIAKSRELRRDYPYVALEKEILDRIKSDVLETLQTLVNERVVVRNVNVNGIGMYCPRNGAVSVDTDKKEPER